MRARGSEQKSTAAVVQIDIKSLDGDETSRALAQYAIKYVVHACDD